VSNCDRAAAPVVLGRAEVSTLVNRLALVTGGSGYFGEVLTGELVARGYRVRIFDLNPPGVERVEVEYVGGDVRDIERLRDACRDVEIVFHNVAQVPLARDRHEFESVNVTGTANVLLASRDARVSKVVHTSSSAVFGIPASNPVTEDTPCRPIEAYGSAKTAAEVLCRDAAANGLDVTIIRPRTILGHGRLGIMAALFELVADGAPVFVLGRGDNRYQFVHASDLASACIRAAERPGSRVYNVGATEFGTMRETLQALVDHAGTGARIRSIPAAPARLAMQAMSGIGLAPFAPYHWMMYGESLWFDVTAARTELDWEPAHSNSSMLIESYEWFREHRDHVAAAGGSHHQTPVKMGVLKLARHLP
jgi:nucleoside-diphosphate-sugar epimerase